MAGERDTSDPKPARAAKPPRTTDPSAERALIYVLAGLMAVTGYVLATALSDPCAKIPDPMLRVGCEPSLSDRLPGRAAYGTIGAMVVMIALCYELRQVLRVIAVAVVGVGLVGTAIAVAAVGMPVVLAVSLGLAGLGLVAAALGLRQESRAAWAFAIAICSVLGVFFFFGSSKVASAAEVSLAVALLPSVAVFLPVTIMLATHPPGRADAAGGPPGRADAAGGPPGRADAAGGPPGRA